MTAPLTPRERVEALDCERAPDTNGHEGWKPAYFSMLALSRQLAAELEEAKKQVQEAKECIVREWRRAETAEKQLEEANRRIEDMRLAEPYATRVALQSQIARLEARAEAAERQLAAKTAECDRLRPEHKCEIVARAPFMAAGRDWWIGKLKEPVAEWPKETHCLHMKTPLKDIVFLCNRGDFEALATLACCYFGEPVNDDWVRSMITYALKAARKETP